MRPRLHYAWVVAAATFVVLLMTAGIRATPGVLMVPLEGEFGWTRVSISAAVAVNIALPLLAGRLSGSKGVAALPVLVFFVAGWALSISPGGDVLLAGGSGGQTAISYATLLLGVLAGAVTAVRVRT